MSPLVIPSKVTRFHESKYS
eukprot:Gb_07707 [translate_table: standard]